MSVPCCPDIYMSTIWTLFLTSQNPTNPAKVREVAFEMPTKDNATTVTKDIGSRGRDSNQQWRWCTKDISPDHNIEEVSINCDGEEMQQSTDKRQRPVLLDVAKEKVSRQMTLWPADAAWQQDGGSYSSGNDNSDGKGKGKGKGTETVND